MADEQSKKTVKKAMEELPSTSRSVQNRRTARSAPSKERALDEQDDLISDVEEDTCWASRNQATIRQYELEIKQAEEEQLIVETLVDIAEVLEHANIKQKAQNPNAPPITIHTLYGPSVIAPKKTYRKRFIKRRRQQVPKRKVVPIDIFQKFLDFGQLSPAAEAWKAAKESGNEKNFTPPPPQKMYVDPISGLRTRTPYRELDFDSYPELLQPTIKQTREEQLAGIKRELELFHEQLTAKESETSGNVSNEMEMERKRMLEVIFTEEDFAASGNEEEKVLTEEIKVNTDLELDSDSSDDELIEEILRRLRLSTEVSERSKPKPSKSTNLNNIIGKFEKSAEFLKEKSEDEIVNYDKNDGGCTSKQADINKNSSDESSTDSDVKPKPKPARKKKSRKSKANQYKTYSRCGKFAK